MPKKVKANGKTFTFDDNVTNEQISIAIDEYFGSVKKKEVSEPTVQKKQSVSPTKTQVTPTLSDTGQVPTQQALDGLGGQPKMRTLGVDITPEEALKPSFAAQIPTAPVDKFVEKANKIEYAKELVSTNNTQELKRLQNEGELPPDSELIAKGVMQAPKIKAGPRETLSFEDYVYKAEDVLKGGPVGERQVERITSKAPKDLADYKAEVVKATDLNIKNPYLFYSKDTDDSLVDQIYGENNLLSIGVNPKDFDGFLNKKGYKSDYLKKRELGVFEETGANPYKLQVAVELEKKRMLDLYLNDIISRDLKRKEYNKEISEIKEIDPITYKINEEELKQTFDKDQYLNYIDTSMPTLSKKLKESDDRNKQKLQDIYDGKTEGWSGLGYGIKETAGNTWNGFVDRINQLATTVSGEKGAEQLRQTQAQRELERTDTRGVGYVGGKSVDFLGNEYLVDDTGNIYDKKLKIRITDTFDQESANKLRELSKTEGKDDWIFSPQGASIQLGGIVGDMIVQLAATRGVGMAGSAAGSLVSDIATYRRLAPLKSIGIKQGVGDAIVSQSALGYSSGMENTLKEAKLAGLNDREAQELASVAAKEMAGLYAITAPLSPQTKATNALFGAEANAIVRDAIEQYKKIGVEGFKATFNRAAEKIAKGAVEFLEEGGKETVQENIQQAGEIFLINKDLNEQAKREFLKADYTADDIVNTSILSFISSGLMSQMKAPNLFRNTDVDNLRSLKSLSENETEFNSALRILVDKGNFSQTEADNLKKDVEVYKRGINKIPKNTKPDVAFSLMKDVDELSSLEEKKKQLDPAFHSDIDEQIKQKRSDIQSRVSYSNLNDKQKTTLKTEVKKELGDNVSDQAITDKAVELFKKSEGSIVEAPTEQALIAEEVKPVEEEVIPTEQVAITEEVKPTEEIVAPAGIANEYIQSIEKVKTDSPEKFWSVDRPFQKEDGTIDEVQLNKAAKEDRIIKTEAGFGIVGEDGDIKGVFKADLESTEKTGDKVIQEAIKKGGIKLDNFALPNLMKIYERNGFREVSRLPFNEEYAPEGWTPEQGTPDVVAMVYDPKGELDIEKKNFTDYDEAMMYRDTFVDQAKKLQEVKPVSKIKPTKEFKKETGKSSLLKRVKEGGNKEYINKIIDKIGINYEKRNQQQVIADAEAFVDEVGIEMAYEAIKNLSIKNGDSVTVIYASIIDRIPKIADNAVEDAKTDTEKEAIRNEYNEFLETVFKEFKLRSIDIGQSTSILNAIYIKNQEVMYSLSVQKEKYKAINGGVIDEETSKKFDELDKRYRESNEKIKELEKKLEESIAEQNFNNIVEQETRNVSKENIGTKARKLAKDIRSGKKSVLPDWAIAEGAKGTKSQGIDFNTSFAKALDTFAGVYEATSDFAKAIEEGFKNIKDWYIKNNIDFNEKDIKTKFSEYVKPKVQKISIKNNVVTVPYQAVVDYVVNGGRDINELAKQLHDESDIPNISVRQIKDIISGYGKRANKSKKQYQDDILRLKSLGRLESQLEDLQNGISKTKDTIKKQQLSDLEKKYKANIRALQDELGITETERTTRAENYTRKRIEQIKEKIANNDFAKKEVVPVTESEELKNLRKEKNRIQEDYDKIIYTQELKNRTFYEKLRAFAGNIIDSQRVTRATGELSFVGAQGGFYMIDSTFSRKTFKNLVTNFKNTTAKDWIKSPIATITKIIKSAHSVDSVINMFNKMGNKNNYDDFQTMLKDHPYYDVFLKSGLRILGEDSKTQVMDEMYIGNNINSILKLPFTGLTKLDKGKKRTTLQGYYEKLKTGNISEKNKKTIEEFYESANPLAVFERGNNTFMNMARIEMFMNGVQALEIQGKNPINNLNEFKDLASAINTVTGSGNLNKYTAMALPILNKLFFSTRFWAASLNMTPPISLLYLAKLGNYESFVLANPKTWGTVRPTVAQKAFVKPMLKGFVAFYGMSVFLTNLINAAIDDDDEMTEEEKKKKRAYIEYDPRSTDYMKVISGDTKTDMFGPYRGNIVLFSRLYTGQTKKGEELIENGSEWGSRTDFQIGTEYIAGKANPFPGMFVRYSMGSKQEVLDEETNLLVNRRMLFDDNVEISYQAKENLFPIFVNTVKEITDEDPVLGSEFYTTLALFGKQSSVYKVKEKKSNGRKSSGSRMESGNRESSGSRTQSGSRE
jgi:hypothetical protein